MSASGLRRAPTSWIVAGLGLLIARRIAAFAAVRATARPPAPSRWIGARGVTVEALRPHGMIRVDGELWRAHAVHGNVATDHDVVVTGARGLTLVVTRADSR